MELPQHPDVINFHPVSSWPMVGTYASRTRLAQIVVLHGCYPNLIVPSGDLFIKVASPRVGNMSNMLVMIMECSSYG
jgi:hypothetical protein